MTFSFLDIIFAVIILLLAVICTTKGFIKEVFGKGAIVLGLWAAVLFHKKLLPFMQKYISFEWLAIGASFLIIFLVVYLVIMIIRQIVSSIFQNEIFKGLDRTLGFVFGAIEGLAVCAVVLIILSAQKWFDVSKLLNESVVYNILKPFIAAPVDSVTGIVEQGVHLPA